MGRCPLSCARITAPAAVIPRNPRREIVMMVYRAYFPRILQRCLLFGRQDTSFRADIVAHEAQGLQHGGPVFQVRGEYLLHQLARPLGNAHVELGGRKAEFVGQVRPIEAVGFPTLRHDAAGVAHEGGEGAQVQKLGLVGVGQGRLGPTTTWSTTAPPASSSSASGMRTRATPPGGGKSAPGSAKARRDGNSTPGRTGNGTNTPAKAGRPRQIKLGS